MSLDKLIQGCFAGLVLATPFVLFHAAVFNPPPMQVAETATQQESELTSEPEPPIRYEPMDPIPRIQLAFSETQQFGIVCPTLRDPLDKEKPKRLTGDERGQTNNTVVRVDGRDYRFGSEGQAGRWVEKSARVRSLNGDLAWQSTWEIRDVPIRVVQTVDIVLTG